VDQQRNEVDRKKLVLKKAESNWREAQRVLQSYQALTDRMTKQAKIVEEKRLQKENDEFATKSFLRIARGN
jgi:flagellar biosynthesis chaperone FliJ